MYQQKIVISFTDEELIAAAKNSRARTNLLHHVYEVAIEEARSLIENKKAQLIQRGEM